MRISRILLVGGIAGLATGSSAMAQPIVWDFPIEGSQEVPPRDTPGFGQGHVELDLDTLTLSWEITYQDLLAPTTGAHFHGAAPPGENAGIRVDIGAISGLDSPMIGSALIDQVAADEIIAGLWYVNIHTEMFPGGEIRGQVVPAPGGLAALALAGMAAMRRRRR